MLLVSACGFDQFTSSFTVERDIERARGMQGPTPFTEALRAEYVDQAQSEYDQADYADGKYHALKAQAAGSGEVILPTAMEERDIPEEHVAELSAARGELIAALDSNARERVPQEAARAQVMFDCWMEQQEENFQPDDIAACRDAFRAALAQLAPPPPAPQPMPAPPARDFLVFFDFDSTEIRPDSATILDDVLEAFAAARTQALPREIETTITLVGHADRSGPDAYNQGLSERRANAVRDYLVTQGNLNPSDITTSGRGETDPRVPTPDGVREQENRRVEIQIN
jgi:OOP family OmpA-OmpF porin